MRFELTALLATLATTCAADRLVVYTFCNSNWHCNSKDATFFTDFGSYPIDANEGCRKPYVPAMTELCMDWNRQRAHFRYEGQGKRCLRRGEMTEYGCSSYACQKTEWYEVSCSWKRGDGEEDGEEEGAEVAIETQTAQN
ncbi:hypothetical protein ACJ41O_009133 [Fusarium nematophilum]